MSDTGTVDISGTVFAVRGLDFSCGRYADPRMSQAEVLPFLKVTLGICGVPSWLALHYATDLNELETVLHERETFDIWVDFRGTQLRGQGLRLVEASPLIEPERTSRMLHLVGDHGALR